MSIQGRIEDISVADIVQFIHIGQRTGALSLTRGEAAGVLTFSSGKITQAVGPTTPPLVTLLRKAAAIDRTQLERLMGRGASVTDSPHLFLEYGVSKDALQAALVEQTQTTAYDLLGWSEGTFTFRPDSGPLVEGADAADGAGLPRILLNPQPLLMEACRRRDSAPQQVERPATQTRLRTQRDTAGPAARLSEPSASPPDVIVAPRRASTFAVLGGDAAFVSLVSPLVERAGHDLASTTLAEILDGSQRCHVVIVDGRTGRPGVKALRALRKLGSTLPVIAVGDASATEAYAAGATSVVAGIDDALCACCQTLARSTVSHAVGLEALAEDLARARAALHSVRVEALDSSMSLHLLKVVSSLVGRAMIWISRGRHMLMVGGMGKTAGGADVAEAMWGMSIEQEEGGVLAQAFADSEVRDGDFDDLALPHAIVKVLGHPADPRAAVLPLTIHGVSRAVLYADTARGAHGLDVGALRIAVTAAGLLVENELLSRKQKAWASAG